MDGLRIFTTHSVSLLRQNMSRALTVPSHLPIVKQYGVYPAFFVSVYHRFQQGEETAVDDFSLLPEDMRVDVIRELLSVALETSSHVVL